MPTPAEERRLARAHAEVRIFREGEGELEADADALYWDRIPINERAEFVWRLSVELYGISNPKELEPPRAALEEGESSGIEQPAAPESSPRRFGSS